jgi:hypothetical protein
MTYITSPRVERPGEHGSALIAVLLLLMMMTALAGALSLGSQTETFVSRNQNSGARAQAAAEAGLNHAVELAVTYIFEWNANGFANYGQAVDALLAGPDGDAGDDADNGSLGARAGIDAAEDIPIGVRLPIAGANGVQYEAFLMDDDDTAPDEDGNLDTDLNDRLIVRATGYGPDNSKVTLEAIISPTSFGAIVTESNLVISGNVSIQVNDPDHPDPDPAVHSNGDLIIEGTSTDINGTLTATGKYVSTDKDLSGTGSAGRVDVPEVKAKDYESWADFKLKPDGTMVNMATGLVVCNVAVDKVCNQWEFNDATDSWSLSKAPPAGTYYVEANANGTGGDAKISGSPGTKDNPIEVSIVAEGNIDISGSPKLVPDTPELLFVTNKDLKIVGSLDIVEGTEENIINVQGQMLVREQVELGGNVSVLGQVIVNDAPDSSSILVTSNHLHGNVEIQYAGGLGGSSFTVTGWRDIRDAD